MINDVTSIAAPYSAVTNKENYTSGDPADVNKLDATQWNNLSSAVATAHTKINQIIGSSNSNASLRGKRIEIESTSDGDIVLTSDGDVNIHAIGDIDMDPNGDLSFAPAGTLSLESLDNTTIKVPSGKSITLTIGSSSVTVSDIITVVNYFKNNTSSGPFASQQ